MKIVIVAGMLAAGKTIALKFFQDLSYYCVDNLPPTLIDNFIELIEKSDPQIDKVAIVVDCRGSAFFDNIYDTISRLKKDKDASILYVDASDDVLISRYKKNRRKHLMSSEDRISVAIEKERVFMQPIKDISQYIIDTSNLIEKDFESLLKEYYSGDSEGEINIHLTSFGFKYGFLPDGDLVFDVRFLPNPFYIKELKPLSGLDKEVSDYVHGKKESKVFYEKIMDLFYFLIPEYEKEGKKQLTIGIGCTGGRHRSVAFVEKIGKDLLEKGYNVKLEHKDLENDTHKVGRI